MQYKPRLLEPSLKHHLQRGKSILLLGPRQTGKSTLLEQIPNDLTVSFLLPKIRQRYEKSPSLLAEEIRLLATKTNKMPLVLLDEVQKIPVILDVVQELVDKKTAQFILTGSSARKLKRGGSINLLPGRVVTLRLDPFVYEEFPESSLELRLYFGNLPGIVQVESETDREVDLESYVETYLEEEVRAEALVRNIGSFFRFLELAGLESGNIMNFRGLSQEIGISHTTVASYFEVLEDCLIAERIDPITQSTTRKKLTKSPRYLLFDLGVRRLCAGEGTRLAPKRLGELFEQYVGLELLRHARLSHPKTKIRFWRDPDGPEVDWIVEREQHYIPVEVKWTEKPTIQEARSLLIFLEEYPEKARHGFVICRTPNPLELHPKITAIPWQQIGTLPIPTRTVKT